MQFSAIIVNDISKPQDISKDERIEENVLTRIVRMLFVQLQSNNIFTTDDAFIYKVVKEFERQ